MPSGNPKYTDPKVLEAKIDEYFEKEVYSIPLLDKEGNPVLSGGKIVKDVKPPTLSGLANYLGFCDRQSLYDYRDKKVDSDKGFSCAIKKAIGRVSAFAEDQLFTGQSTGAIFWLKNAGWKDRQDITSDDKAINQAVAIVPDKKSAEDWGKE